MDNNFNQNQQQFDPFANGMQNQTPKKPAGDIFPLISIILSGVGMLLVLIGTILTCTCSKAGSTSPVFILTIFGIITAIVGVVMAILSVKDFKQVAKASKIAMVGFVLGVFAIIYGILPTVTICGYNCHIKNQAEDALKDTLDDLGNLDNYTNPFN